MSAELFSLTRSIHALDRKTGRVSLLDVLKDSRCSVPSCSYGPDGGPGLASVAILNVVSDSGIVLVGGSSQGSTLYLCESHLQENGEAEADTFAELQRSKPL